MKFNSLGTKGQLLTVFVVNSTICIG